MREPNFMGLDGFVWFQGVVEDRQDPKKLGRCRVRILGAHVGDKKLIPTEELIWAYILQPITSAAMSGLGETPLGPVPGTWVIGFFRDGDDRQDPIIMGTISGIPEEAARNDVGFYDPRDNNALVEKLQDAPRKIEKRSYPNDGTGATLTNETKASTYPRVSQPLGCGLNEPDTNRLARNDPNQPTIIQTKIDNTVKSIPIAFGGTWDEPTTPYAAIYPYNHVKESESGHIEEIDDTPNAERTHRWHRSGTFEERHPGGSQVEKVVLDNFIIILRNNDLYIENTQNETVQNDYNLYVKGNFNIQVDKNYNCLIKGGAYIQVEGELDFTVGGAVNIKSGGDFSVDAPNIWLNSGHANSKTPKQ
jgi:Gp5 N-terminal OB domain